MRNLDGKDDVLLDNTRLTVAYGRDLSGSQYAKSIQNTEFSIQDGSGKMEGKYDGERANEAPPTLRGCDTKQLDPF